MRTVHLGFFRPDDRGLVLGHHMREDVVTSQLEPVARLLSRPPDIEPLADSWHPRTAAHLVTVQGNIVFVLTPGIAADDVLNGLERKYQAIVDAAGTAK